MKVYVAGPMTGYEDWNRPAFHAAAARLRSFGYEVVNPAELDWGMTDEELAATPHHVFLHRDLKALLECDLIYPLPGAEWSKGATLEMQVAKGTGIFTLADPDLDVWRGFEGKPIEEREPEPHNDTHPENPDEGVFDSPGPCSELTCPQHGERNRRAAEVEGLDLLAAERLVAAGEFAKGGPVFGDMPILVDDTLPPNVIRVQNDNGGVIDITFDLPLAAEAPESPEHYTVCPAVQGDGTGNEWCVHGVRVSKAEDQHEPLEDEEGSVALPDEDPAVAGWDSALARFLFGVLGGRHA